MMQYELTFLLNEETQLKNIRELIASMDGKILKEDNWGKKTLAYSIKKNTAAFFYNWAFKMDKSKLAEFKQKLNFNEKLIRYLLLAVDEE